MKYYYIDENYISEINTKLGFKYKVYLQHVLYKGLNHKQCRLSYNILAMEALILHPTVDLVFSCEGRKGGNNNSEKKSLLQTSRAAHLSFSLFKNELVHQVLGLHLLWENTCLVHANSTSIRFHWKENFFVYIIQYVAKRKMSNEC